jgi:hypothetical protein
VAVIYTCHLAFWTSRCVTGIPEVRSQRVKITVFWKVAPCSSIHRYQHFRTACCFHLQGHPSTLRMEAASFSQKSGTYLQATQCHIADDCHINHPTNLQHVTDTNVFDKIHGKKNNSQWLRYILYGLRTNPDSENWRPLIYQINLVIRFHVTTDTYTAKQYNAKFDALKSFWKHMLTMQLESYNKTGDVRTT